MKGVTVKTLQNGAQVMWAVPTGGFGHAADEQPLPYIRYKGQSLSPRYGGDESLIQAGYDSLPLPSLKLLGGMPLMQRLFNLRRRRVNLYWRNIFKSVSSCNEQFIFAQQLDYLPTESGFVGNSPILTFSRNITLLSESLIVDDLIVFKRSMDVFDLKYGHFPVSNASGFDGSIEVSSSTGGWFVANKLIHKLNAKKGQVISSRWELNF